MNSSLTSDLLLSITLFLMGVVILIDFKWNRIPNLICICFVLVGLTIQINMNSYYGFLLGFIGMGTGLILFLPFYFFKGMAAGDVKLLASLGALLGPLDIMLAAASTLVIGAVLAFTIVIVKAFLIAGWNSISDLFRSYAQALNLFLISRSLVMPQPASAELRNIRFPYAIAITAGCTTVLVQGSLLNFIHLKALVVSQLGIAGGLL